MNATLNIDGTATAINTWDVRMTNIEVVNKTDGASNNEELTKINDDGVTAIFRSDFTKPGDYITYEVTVENRGSIDAILEDISITLNAAEQDKDLFNITDTRSSSELLEAGTSTTFTIKVEFRSDADRMPSSDIEYTVKVDYSQQTEIPSEGETEEDWTFKVNSDGLITAYNYEKGTDVVVPAEVDGIPVKSISSNAFSTSYNVAMIHGGVSQSAKAVIFDVENYDALKNYLTNYLGVAEDCIYTESEAKTNGYTSDSYMNFYIDLSSNVTLKDKSGKINLDLSNAINLETIDDGALLFGAASVNFGNITSLRRIGMYSFCITGLTGDLIIPEGVTTIGYQAFVFNDLNSVTIPSTIESISSFAFSGNSNLQIININKTQSDFEANVKVESGWYDAPTTLKFIEK